MAKKDKEKAAALEAEKLEKEQVELDALEAEKLEKEKNAPPPTPTVAKKMEVLETKEFYVKRAGHFATLQKGQVIDSVNYDFADLTEQGVKLKEI